MERDNGPFFKAIFPYKPVVLMFQVGLGTRVVFSKELSLTSFAAARAEVPAQALQDPPPDASPRRPWDAE